MSLALFGIALAHDYQKVTGVTDASVGQPTDGTTFDPLDLFPVNIGGGTIVNLAENEALRDPALGSADAFQPFPGFENFYVHDSGGFEDLLTACGHTLTLFDIPALGGAASGLSDGAQQLLPELGIRF